MDANCGSGSSGSTPQEDVASLKREVSTLHNALQLQSSTLAREQRRAGGLAVRLTQRDTHQEARRAHADKQAAALLRALLVLEASLRREQATILQKLQAKDVQIQRQREEIQRLKSERRTHCANCQQIIGFTSEQTNIETDPEFHSLDSVENHKFERSMSYHESHQQPFQKNSRLSKSFQLPKSDIKGGSTSSSEEVFDSNDTASLQSKGTYVKNKQAFVRKDVTRRSRKFSGRRHSSAYLDTVQKRQSRTQGSSSSAEDGPMSERDSKFHPDGVDNCDIGEEISKDIQKASNRIDELLNNANSSNHVNDNLPVRRIDRNKQSPTLSGKIDSLHGIRKPVNNNLNNCDGTNPHVPKESSLCFEKPWYTNVSDPEPESDSQYGTNVRLGKTNCRSNSDKLSSGTPSKTDKAGNSLVNGAVYKHESVQMPVSPVSIFNNQSISDKDKSSVNHDSLKSSSLQSKVDSKSISFEGCNNNFDNEPNENWYASASDPDDDQSCEIYKNNPVLECVNQILLQNSLDENSSDSPRTYESPSPKSSTKRVQFSTLNSISFDESVGKNGQECNNAFSRELQRLPERRSSNKIVKFSLETASEHSYEVPITSEGFNYEVQSIYSNDYEPILTMPNEAQRITKTKPVPLPRNSINKGNGESSPKKMSNVKNIAMSLENKINSNHYVDMETKYGNPPGAINRKKVPRVPPALPPKPKNLVSKFKLNNSNSTGTNSQLTFGAMNSDTVVSNQRTTDVPSAKSKVQSSKSSIKSGISTEPDYCSISEINVPVVSSGKRGLISTQATVEIHTEKFSPNIDKRSVPKLATISKITPNKITDKDIPKLPQVTEIIIPDDDDINESPKIAHENFPGKLPPHLLSTGTKMDHRNSIQMGHSVSTILTDIKNRRASIEDVNKSLMSAERNFSNGQKSDRNIKIAEKSRIELPIFEAVENECEKFDLSQNFEEFKIDDCEFTAEEYRISSNSDSGSTDSATDEANANVLNETAKLNDVLTIRNPAEGPYRIEFTAEDDLNAKNLALNSATNGIDSSKVSLKNYSKMSNKPDLLSNIDNVETDSVRYSDLESSNSSSSNCGSYNTVKCEPATFAKETLPAVKIDKHSVPFEYFLESSGLSSKSILTPSRPPNSNHKSVQKPKDIKMKSKVPLNPGRVTPLYERLGANTAIKYFEPYI